MWKKIEKQFFVFEITASELLIVFVKLSLLRREYLSTALNVFKNSLKILHIAKIQKCRKKLIKNVLFVRELHLNSLH